MDTVCARVLAILQGEAMIRAVIPPTPAVVRKAQRRTGQAIAVVIFSAGLLAGVGLMAWLIGYQAGVTRELVAAWGQRVNILEDQYKRDHAMKTTKMQAAGWMDNKEKERVP